MGEEKSGRELSRSNLITEETIGTDEFLRQRKQKLLCFNGKKSIVRGRRKNANAKIVPSGEGKKHLRKITQPLDQRERVREKDSSGGRKTKRAASKNIIGRKPNKKRVIR